MGSGYQTFVAGNVLSAAEVNDYLMDQAVMSFADSASRDTALSGQLAEGMIAYLRDSNILTWYDGSSWANVSEAIGTVAVADGGTGATDAGTARTNLGVAIGSDVQAYDADLGAIAGLAKTNGNFIVGNGSTWVAESGATARTSLGVAIGSDVQAYDADLTELGAMAVTSFTPSWTNFSIGNGSQNCYYVQAPRFMFVWGQIEWGSTSSISGTAYLTIPNSATMPNYLSNGAPVGMARFRDVGTSSLSGQILASTSTQVQFNPHTVSGSYIGNAAWSNTVPFTWGSGDLLQFSMAFPIN